VTFQRCVLSQLGSGYKDQGGKCPLAPVLSQDVYIVGIKQNFLSEPTEGLELFVTGSPTRVSSLYAVCIQCSERTVPSQT
jgi:thymidine kinase